MTTLILMIVALFIIRAVFRWIGAKVRGAGHIATETVVQHGAEPQDWGPIRHAHIPPEGRGGSHPCTPRPGGVPQGVGHGPGRRLDRSR